MNIVKLANAINYYYELLSKFDGCTRCPFYNSVCVGEYVQKVCKFNKNKITMEKKILSNSKDVPVYNNYFPEKCELFAYLRGNE